MTEHRFQTLDAIRGAAAFTVLVHHMELNAGYDTHYFLKGYLAVDLFFILSGFVIGYAYEQRLLAKMTFREFISARLTRLLPIIVLGATLGVTVEALRGNLVQWWWAAFALQLFFIPLFPSARSLYSFNGAQWSLLFELLANLLYAMIVRVLGLRVLVALVVANAIGLFLAAHHWGNLGLGWGSDNFLGGLPRAGFGFFAGVLLWRLWQSELLPKIRFPSIAVVALTLSIAAVMSLPLVVRHWYFEPIMVVIGFPLLVWLGAGSVMRGVGQRVGLLVGTLSYPLYALQGPVRRFMGWILGNPVQYPPWMMLMTATAALAVSWLAFRYFDEPARRAIRGLLNVNRRRSIPRNAAVV